jgi:hypothetical protein
LASPSLTNLSDFHTRDVDPSLDQFGVQNVTDLPNLEFILSIEGQGRVTALNASITPLEIKTIGDFTIGLVHPISDLMPIELANHIK